MLGAWTIQADRALLLSMMEVAGISNIKWDEIAATIEEKGFVFTASACKQHYQKIRKEVKSNEAAQTDGATPSKRKKSKGDAMNDGADDEEDLNPSPTKKGRKTKTTKSEQKVEKTEDDKLGGLNGQSATQFKIENDGEVIDLEGDKDEDGYYA